MPESFDAEYSSLAGDLPIALLPVRIETRYFNEATELRVRIYPDQLHIDSHEKSLTQAELDHGIAYWKARCAKPNPALRNTSPWLTICSAIGAPRAAWVVKALLPNNLPTPFEASSPAFLPNFPSVVVRDANWSNAAKAVALPKRWLVVGKKDGSVVFRKWSSPIVQPLDTSVGSFKNDDVVPEKDLLKHEDVDKLPIQDGARWMIDFDVAEDHGMAVRIANVDLTPGVSAASRPTLAKGLDRLWVLGVATDRRPEDSAIDLLTLLENHTYTDGVSAIAPGTPTNASRDVPAGATPNAQALANAYDPEKITPSASASGTDSERLWHALGMEVSGSGIASIPGALSTNASTAAHMANALWESTLGSYLVDYFSPKFNDAASFALREHVQKYLVPSGPYPAIRVGRQPYGVLPVLVPKRFQPVEHSQLEAELFGQILKLRAFWEAVMGAAPRLGRTNDIDADLADLLQSTPQSATYKYRPFLGPLLLNATQGLEHFTSVQESTLELMSAYMGWGQVPKLAGMAAHPVNHTLWARLVEPKADEALLSNNYLKRMAGLAFSGAKFEDYKQRAKTETLLEVLALNALSRELHLTDMRTLNRHRVAEGVIPKMPEVSTQLFGEFTGIEVASPSTSGSNISTVAQAGSAVIPNITGSKTIRQHVADSIKSAINTPPDYRSLTSTVTSLNALGERPVAELELALRGWLDACAFRLDAWFTSLAQRRLVHVRSLRPKGVHLGAYGWVDDLKPDALASQTSRGYIHAPSIPQAATAALLRSGHFAHESKALQIDLRSSRVRVAKQLLEGVSNGQPLTALLGYRLERTLRESDLQLAKYILPLREAFPLRPSREQVLANGDARETIAAHDVVDAVALLERWRTQRTDFFARFLAAAVTDQGKIEKEFNKLADAYDAVADALVAEVVHQNVLGNTDRAGAALAALDRQEPAPSLEFLKTPRSGFSYSQRVLVLLTHTQVAPSWASLMNDMRGRAEPRLNAWIAHLLGDPSRWLIQGLAKTEQQTQAIEMLLPELGLSPLSLVLASRASAKGAPSELEARVVLALSAKVSAPTQSTEIELTKAGLFGFEALAAILQWIHALITTKRPATASDLELPQHATDSRIDVVELRVRVSAALLSLQEVAAQLRGLGDLTLSSPIVVRAALLRSAEFGVYEALPSSATVGELTDEARQELVQQTKEVLDVIQGRIDKVSDPTGNASETESPVVTAENLVAKMRLMFGEGFPVLPVFTVGNAEQLSVSLNQRASLLANDDTAPMAWLQRMGLVREETQVLANVLHAAELTDADLQVTDIEVVHLPHLPGQTKEKWLALPFIEAERSNADLAIALITHGALHPAATMSGLFVDGWSETIPAKEELTGVAFHHDAPGARAPQAILLAVPPRMIRPSWTVDVLLETIEEAHDLARLRAIGPQHLHWPSCVLPALMLPESAASEMPSVDFKDMVVANSGLFSNVLGKS